MALKDTMAADADNVFLTDFAETIGYTVVNPATAEANIPAVIDTLTREELREVSAALNFRTKAIEVSAAMVAKPNRAGMPGENGGDLVRLPASYDLFNATWYVRKILSSDGAMHRLLIADNQAALT